MKTKISTLLIFGAFSMSYSAFEIIPVSPYINRGASFKFQIEHNPLAVVHYYEKEAQGDQYAFQANRIYFTNQSNLLDVENFFEYFRTCYYLTIGTRNEKLEFTGMIKVMGIMPPMIPGAPGAILRLRSKLNHIDNGENSLFKNVALSSFIGLEMQSHSYGTHHGGYNDDSEDKEIYLLYSGISVGTRKKVASYSYFEMFTNPQLSLTHYTNLGGRFDPVNIINFDYVWDHYSGTFGLSVPDFTMPIGVGIKHKNLFMRTGGAFSTTIGKNTRNLNRYRAALVDKVVFESNNFSFFLEIGIHFRKFRELEKEANNDRI
jgi:hypothetical protein